MLLLTAAPCAAAMDAWHFRSLTNEKPISLSDFKNAPLLLIFWRSDCAPCLHEIKNLQQIAASYPQLQIAIISLQNTNIVQKYLPNPIPKNAHILMALDDEKPLLASFNNNKAALPFSAFMHAEGSICAIHEGILGTDTIDQWIKSC